MADGETWSGGLCEFESLPIAVAFPEAEIDSELSLVESGDE